MNHRERVVSYMIAHKGVTFQSMARSMELDDGLLYDIVNGKPVKKSVLKVVKRWLKEHKKDHPKVRFK